MKQFLNTIIHNKGEGVMLREPKSIYHKGKSNCLFKMKVSGIGNDDNEGLSVEGVWVGSGYDVAVGV